MRVYAQREVRVPLRIGEAFARVVGQDYDFRFELEVERAKRLTPGPLRIGTRYEVQRRFFGVPAVSVEEVVELDPPRRIALGAGFAGMHVVGTWSFYPENGATRMVVALEMPSSGVGKVLASLMAPMLRRQMRENMRALERELSGTSA